MVLDEYKTLALDTLARLKPQLNLAELSRAIDYSIQKRYKEEPCVVDNNYTKSTLDSTLQQMADWIMEQEPICTAYGVMFKRHTDKINPLIDLVRFFMEDRDVHKKAMIKAINEQDYETAETENLLQLLTKRDNNSIYGAMGQSSCVLYNLYIAASVTAQGRSVISSATMFFEGFMANNVKFGSLEEVLVYINNIVQEKPNRKFNDINILDRNITVEECFVKLILTCGDWRRGKIKWIPDKKDMHIIYDILRSESQEDINRIYYKNNLYKFMDNQTMTNAIKYILKSLTRPYLTPSDIPDEIRVELDTLQDFIREYVHYPHMYIDRIDRCNNMIKDVCVISDTDSTIVCFDRWYKYILNKIMGEKLTISSQEFDIDGYYKDMIAGKIVNKPKMELRYDFFKDEVVERESILKPFTIIPQNNLRFSIINIIAYISGNLCNEYIELYTKHNHSWAPNKKCLLYLKNEFLFSRALLTDNKKNYATNRELQEGAIIKQTRERALDIKGLPINKSTMNDYAKDRLQKILYDQILTSDTINPERIIEEIAIFEKDIEASLMKGERKYYKPLAIKALSSYEDPMRIQGIKAAIVWNKVKGPDLEAIDLDARNTIDVVKVNITPLNIEKIKDKYPDVYERFIKFFQDTNFFKNDSTITTIAVPLDIEVPEWIREFIDIKTITNDNITNFPFESVGITRLGASNINYSTIMKI